MTARVLLALAGLVLLSADAKDDVVKKELEKLQGTWVLTTIETSKGSAPQDVTTDERTEMTIRGNKWKGGQVGAQHPKDEWFLRIDPNKSPKSIDVCSTEAFKPGEAFFLIYELKGDLLMICDTEPTALKPENRPKQLKSTKDSPVVIVVWKRKN